MQDDTNYLILNAGMDSFIFDCPKDVFSGVYVTNNVNKEKASNAVVALEAF
ncbi:MAG: hypothetical protein JNL70_09215 [Saprospiraceae bacterium]|nr:hypothetical protein [Saprospiraceae bacterium]